jgi:diketogulonate reductase-like aldo/keto reductase
MLAQWSPGSMEALPSLTDIFRLVSYIEHVPYAAWAMRSGNVIAIPESGSAAHVRENVLALSLMLTSEELESLDAAHPLGQ